MMNYLFYFVGLTVLFLNFIHTKTINTNIINTTSTTSTTSNINNNINDDQYYLIYVNNTHGEYKIFSETSIQKRQVSSPSQLFVDSLVDDIHSLIIDNMDTYQDPEKLKEIEEPSPLNEKRKRNFETYDDFTNNESNFVYPISSIGDSVILYAYLSNSLINQIRSKFNSIIDIIPSQYSASIHHQNYNIQDILFETGWKNLTVRENADFHLSLVSQGIYNKNLVMEYDNNYYYPSSAGKDVDIIIMDTSFHFNYSEFANTGDRSVKCLGNVKDGKVSTENIDTFCGSCNYYHGEIVSATAAGLTHGVANRANVYGISLPQNEKGEIKNSDILGALQYIYENKIRPHRTVINISLGEIADRESPYYNHYKSLIDAIINKGGIIVAAAGNQGFYLDDIPYPNRILPCQLDNVICVGGINNNDKRNFNQGKYGYVYGKDPYSNFGSSVTIYAPYHVTVDILKEDTVEQVKDMGTSFSSPIVAGIIATIISENEDKQYTQDTIFQKLYANGKSEPIRHFNMENILANNGKHIVYSENGQYHGCGIYAGNIQCPKDKN